MADAHSSNIIITEDDSCGYCLQRLPYMTDPRALPCSHVFCLSCLSNDFTQSRVIICTICGIPHRVKVLKDLEEVNVANIQATNDVSELDEYEEPCDLCKAEETSAVSYCVDCGKKLCEKHLQIHENYWQQFSRNGHETIGIDTYSSSPNTYVAELCEKHQEERLILACKTCYSTFCARCEIAEDCSDDEENDHSICSLRVAAEMLRNKLSVPMKPLSESITERCKLEKMAWTHLDEVEVETKEMINEVEEVAREQVKCINKESSTMEARIRQYLADATASVAAYTTTLTTNKDETHKLWKSANQLVTSSNNSQIIAGYKLILAQLDASTLFNAIPFKKLKMSLVSTDASYRSLERRFDVAESIESEDEWM